MRWKRRLALGVFALFSGAISAQAQAPVESLAPPTTVYVSPAPPTAIPVALPPGNPAPIAIPSGVRIISTQAPSPSSQPAVVNQPVQSVQVIESAPAAEPALGPTPPEDVKLLMDTALGCRLAEHGIRAYGWLDTGYTYNSSGPGPTTVMPHLNHFGNEILVNQIAAVIEKTLKQDELSFGFNATFYAGADPADIQPKGEFNTSDPRFGADFRQLYVSAHIPGLTEGGVDVKLGRMGTIIGYNSALAPYRPMYSSDYQWFYSQDGAWTGALATAHVSKQLDVVAGITMGANTFFTMRGDAPCYIGQVNYWLQEEKKTQVTASLHIGNQAIFAATPPGDIDTVVEFRIVQNWNKCLTQVVQTNMGWENNIPGVGTGSWYGVYNQMNYHLNPTVDLNNRIEWFDDVKGTRTGFDTNYLCVVFGLDIHPVKWLSVRPEVRGDFSADPVFRNGNEKSQLTIAVDALIKF